MSGFGFLVRANMTKKNTTPFFVVGTQRSGTTLLCRMLSAHPNLFTINEIGGIQQILPSVKNGSEAYDIIDRHFESKKHAKIQEVLNREGKVRWGLKEPALTYCLEEIKSYFPESKIIFIVRDGRAVANSYLQVKWGVANIYAAGERWKREIEIQRMFWEANPDICWHLKYEDLLANPAKELESISSFLNEVYSPLMLAYNKKPEKIIKLKSANENAFRQIDRNIETKWKKELSEFQVRVFESIAGEQLKEFGYPLVNESYTVPPLLKLWWMGHQKVVGEMQVQYQWRIKPLLSQFMH